MRVAISGADGFLGTHVLNQLRLDAAVNVVAITLFPQKVRKQFYDWNDLQIVPAEYNGIRCSDSLDNVDVYIACAFPRASVPEQMGTGLDFVYDSLSLMLNKGCRAVINISSQSVYDPCRKRPAKETDPVVLTSTYAVAKYCVELTVQKLCSERRIPYANVRMASLVGPGFDQRFVNKMIKSAVNNRVVRYVEGNSKHAFLDVQDAAEGLVYLVQSIKSLQDGVVNLGPDNSYSTSEIAHCVSSIVAENMGHPISMELVGHEKNFTCSEIDPSKLQGILGWVAKTSIMESINAIYMKTEGVGRSEA